MAKGKQARVPFGQGGKAKKKEPAYASKVDVIAAQAAQQKLKGRGGQQAGRGGR